MRRLGVLGAIVAVLLLGIVLLLSQKAKAPETPQNAVAKLQKFENDVHGVELNYPTSATASALTDVDKADRFILIASENGDNPYKLYLKYEDGLRAVTTATKVSVLDFMLENLEKSYPKQFPDYKKISERRFELNGKDVAEVVFTYKGGTGETVKQQVNIITKDSNKAFYLSLQSKESDFDALKQTFKEVTESMKIL